MKKLLILISIFIVSCESREDRMRKDWAYQGEALYSYKRDSCLTDWMVVIRLMDVYIDPTDEQRRFQDSIGNLYSGLDSLYDIYSYKRDSFSNIWNYREKFIY